jgi:hypothetical protein
VLVAKLGATDQTTPIGDTLGGLSPLDQPMCASAKLDAAAPPPVPYNKGELAKLVFGGGIVHGYAIRRPKPDALEIESFDMGDTTCPRMHECPPKPVATLAIPSRVKHVREHIVLVDGTGKAKDFPCAID